MVQFKPYSVFVHGSFLNETAFALLGVRTDANGDPIAIGSFEKKPDYSVQRNPAGQIRTKLENWVLSKGYLWPDSSPKALAYERDVMAMLDRINKTIVGSELLRCINRESNVIIAQYNSFEKMARGVCNATTNNRKSFDGFVRILYTPDVACENTGYEYPTSGEETLVHELFHAYLASHDLSVAFYDSMRESSTQEEFLAVQVTNMFRAETGRGVFQRVYGGTGKIDKPVSVSRAQLEDYFVADQEARDVLNPEYVPLFQRYSRYPQLPLNPFRDWGKFQLKASNEAAKAKRPYRMHYQPGI